MGQLVNPGNEAFIRKALNGKVYVDKTGLLEVTNDAIDTPDNLICNSRPRRFGKTVTANMLCAYYCRTCNSEKLFDRLNISKHPDFKKYLNKYDVIYWDMQWCIGLAQGVDNLLAYITSRTLEELKGYYPQIKSTTVTGAMSDVYESTGKGFIVIVDEWDVLIRDYANRTDLVDQYIDFLRDMFKGLGPDTYIHLAYMTGILPIKKVKTQSSLNNFRERTMVDPVMLAPYVGFTEEEVKELCTRYNKDFQQMKQWYDGYKLGGYHIYNPIAVATVVGQNGMFKSYWSDTGSNEVVIPLINSDYDGLKTALVNMLAGEEEHVDISDFKNDVADISTRDDVLTYMIHLGYLAYNQDNKTAFIPNEEIRLTLVRAVSQSHVNDLKNLLRDSDTLLRTTLTGDSDTVAKMIRDFHMKYTSVIKYRDENSVSSVLMIAYLSALNYYALPIRELPTGEGYADFVYIPKPEFLSKYPALIMELKYDKSPEDAIYQIYQKQYASRVLQYTKNILLVGINYNKDTKKHECLIEQYDTRKEIAPDPLSAKTKKAIRNLDIMGTSAEDIAETTHTPIEQVYECLGYVDIGDKQYAYNKVLDVAKTNNTTVQELVKRLSKDTAVRDNMLG